MSELDDFLGTVIPRYIEVEKAFPIRRRKPSVVPSSRALTDRWVVRLAFGTWLRVGDVRVAAR
jgi:hypothetical protein